jgi:hypothetical protein
MLHRSSIGALALALALAWAMALCVTLGPAQAFDESKYPDWKGQWRRVEPGDPVRFDPTKPAGAGQQAPLTPEYQSKFEANLADQAAGGQGDDRTYICFSPGMPRIMNVYTTMEIVVLPETTYVLIDHIHDDRRIFTDGRDWAADDEPSFAGYSIGRWVDEDGDGRYDRLDVETRDFKGPRAFETTGLPLHTDNQTIVKERIYSDRADPNILHDEITTFDHALTRPWTVLKSYRRVAAQRPFWRETICADGNQHVEIAGESYFLSAEGLLMPAKKNQAAPDLRYFNQLRK